jgi:predicted nucleic acid-binding Zn ribbon protein
MPLYEYRCVEDGSLITLLRSMAEADDSVIDPASKGRSFERVQSLFSVDAADTPQPRQSGGGCCGGGCGCS